MLRRCDSEPPGMGPTELGREREVGAGNYTPTVMAAALGVADRLCKK